jgi:hypothetical protein
MAGKRGACSGRFITLADDIALTGGGVGCPAERAAGRVGSARLPYRDQSTVEVRITWNSLYQTGDCFATPALVGGARESARNDMSL